jgi:hypothetical protein
MKNLIIFISFQGNFSEDSDGTDIEFSENGNQFLITIRHIGVKTSRENLQLNFFVNGTKIEEELNSLQMSD